MPVLPAAGQAPPLPRRSGRQQTHRPPPPAAGGRVEAALALLGGAALCALSFAGGGGLNLSQVSFLETGLTLGCGVALALLRLAWAAGRIPLRPPARGVRATVLLFAFALLCALSALWSVEPDGSWQAANKLFSYALFFALVVALGHAFPRRYRAVLGTVAVWGVLVCGYALLTKIFPELLAANESYARLQAPYGYWIATGLTGALGALATVWLGARREGHALVRIAAFPALALQLVALLLTYSRGPLAVLVIGLALWLAWVPLRLRAVAVLAVGVLGAAGPVAFAFTNHALASEGVGLAARESAGHQLGVALISALLFCFCAGLAVVYINGRRAPSLRLRRRLGTLLLCGLLLVVLAGVAALAASHRGLFGTVSHDLATLVNPNATPPPNTPGRLTAVANVRARYWKEALETFANHPLLGVGAEGYGVARLRYRDDTLLVRQPHGFVVEVLADLGLVGLLVVGALFVSWFAAARRPLSARQRALSPEQLGLRTLGCIVFAFGLHSFIDWTWLVPGTALAGLLAAGWLAARGSAAGSRPSSPPHLPRPVAFGAALAPCLLVIPLALSQLTPQLAAERATRALSLLAKRPDRAQREARGAVSEDPFSLHNRFVLAAVEQARGEAALARATLARAVALQSANPASWQVLGEYDLSHGNPGEARKELEAAVYLNPMAARPPAQIAGSVELVALHNAYLRALSAAAP